MNGTRQATWMVGMALLAGLLLRLLFLGSKSLWLDEALSINMARTTTQLLSSRFDNAHPPLYYFLLHYWLPLGSSEFILRLSSALVSTLAIPLSYALAANLGGRRVAYTMLWLTALAPLFIWYAQELRGYSLLLMLGLLASLAMSHLVAQPNWGWFALFVVGMAGALYTHYAAPLLVAAQLGILAVLYLQQRITRRGLLLWLGAWPVVLLLYVPWLRSPGMRAFLDLVFADIPYPVRLLALRFSISPTLMGIVLLVVALVIAVVLLAALISLLRRGSESWNRWAAAPWLRYGVLVLCLAFTVVSVIPRLYTAKKFIVALWPYGLLMVAWLFPWKSANRLPLIVLLAASLVGSVVNATFIPKDEWREMVAYIESHGEAGDSVWVVPRYQEEPLKYYLARGTAADFEVPAVEPSMNDDQLAELVDEGQRVWLIYHTVDFRLRDPERRIERWLMEHFEAVEHVQFHRINATLYTPRS